MLGVALGVAVVVAMALAIQSSREAFRVSTETVAGRATHTVAGGLGGLEESLFTRLRLEGGIRSSAPVVEGFAATPALPGTALRVLGVDPFSEGPFRSFLTGGRSRVDVASLVAMPGAVVLSAAAAARAGVAPGDSLPVRVEGRDYRLTVVGVLEPEERLARAGVRDLLVMDLASAQELLGMEGRLSRIDLRVKEGEEGEDELRRVAALLPEGARLEPAGTRAVALAAMIRAFDLNLTALSLLALVFGMFLIYNAMTFSVVQRREFLGTLRALGVTRREIVAGILGEALWVGSAGAALGVLLGIVLGRGLVRMVARTVNDLYFVVSVEGLALPGHVLAGGGALGLLATLLAALPPALEAAAGPPRAAQLRSVGESSARRAVPRAAAFGLFLAAGGAALLAVPAGALSVSFAALFLIILGMALAVPLGTVALVGVSRPALTRGAGILGAMASRGVVTALSRTAPAVASLVVAVSVTVGLGVMIESFRGTLDRWLEGTLVADVYVSLPTARASQAEGTLDAAAVAAIRAHPDVVGWNTYRGANLFDDAGVSRLLAVELDPRGEAAFDFREGGGREAFAALRNGTGVLISEPYAYRRGLSVGDTVTLPAARGPGRWSVAGVFADYTSDQGVVMMGRAAYDAAWDDDGITSLGLFLREGADAEAIVDELAQRVPATQSLILRTNAALRSGSLEVFDRTFRVTAVLRLLAFAVAFVGVLSALMALQLERAREFGVLRANGLTPGQVWSLVSTQTGLLGVISGVLAVPVGLVISWVMIYVVNQRSFGWTLHMEVGAGVILQAVALALAAAVLAGLYPAWRISRTPPAAALRGE